MTDNISAERQSVLPEYLDHAKSKKWERGQIEKNLPDRKSTRLNSSHIQKSRMPSSA